MTGCSAQALKQELEQEIITGILTPGTRLDEVSLARRFNVSRTPVREALNQLSMLGIVELRPRRGAIVATIGLPEILELFEVMAELESFCGRLATERMTEDEKQRLRSIHLSTEKPVEKNLYDDYYDINVHFHEAIYYGAKNAFLAKETMRLRNRVGVYRRLQLRAQNRIDKSFAEHGAIVDAIINGDGDLAASLLKDHVSVQSGSFRDFVATLSWNMTENNSAQPTREESTHDN